MIELLLPYPPSTNRMWRTPNKGPLAGRTMLSADGRAYREAVATSVMVQRAGKGREPLVGRLAVHIVFAAPDKRRRDADNLLKGLLDAMAHAGVYLDDEQIDDLRIVRGPIAQNNGQVAVRIQVIEALHAAA